MKVFAAVSVVAVMAMTSGVYAGGLNLGLPILSPKVGVGVKTGDINVLNGVAIGNNSSILSGIGNVTGNNTLNGVLNGNVLNVLTSPKKGH